VKWTKLKAAIESRFAKSVRGRVTCHQARYRSSHEELGRIWIAVDGHQIAEFSSATGLRRRSELADQIREVSGNPQYGIPGQDELYHLADKQARAIGRRAGEQTDDEVLDELAESLSLSLESALSSPSPLVRGLALLDRRLGKRRLRQLAFGVREHPLVQALYRIRCEADGVLPRVPAA
jgi:hypothetical protein